MRKESSKKQRKPWVPLAALGVLALIVVLVVFLAQHLPNNTQTPTPTQPRKIAIDITIVGEEVITVELGGSYSDEGASAEWHYVDDPGGQHFLEVTCDNQLDLNKVGTHTITYTAQFEGVEAKAVRQIRVVDIVPPTIELVTNPDHYTLPNQQYQEEGFRATDNYDGDITDQVQRIVSQDGKTVTYRVTDSSGNQAEVVRDIVFDDRDAPELTLKGEKKITITAGTEWKEPGYTASDNVEGDLTKSVTISGTVNHRSAGTYVLTYTVTDQYGNKASLQRTVVVKAAPKPDPKPQTPNNNIDNNNNNSTQGKGKTIYLTFDDGPSKHTERLLKVLDKYKVKATFFVCKTGRLDLLDDIAKAGHSIGIHSMTHKYDKIYASEDAFFQDFDGMAALIKQYSGVTPTISRFPGGSSNSVSKNHCKGIMTRLAKAVQDLGYQYFDWNIDSNDAGGTKTADGVYQNVTQRISKSKSSHLVVLQHDIYQYSVDAVERIIIWGLQNGYSFAALTNSSPESHHTINN